MSASSTQAAVDPSRLLRVETKGAGSDGTVLSQSRRGHDAAIPRIHYYQRALTVVTYVYSHGKWLGILDQGTMLELRTS